VSVEMIYEHHDREKLEEIIILRGPPGGPKKKLIDYKESIITNKMRNNLKKINHALRETFIGLYIPDSELNELNKRLAKHPDPQKQPINFHAKRLCRIFNRTDEFTHGGRFYGGWWQNISKEYRKFIRISENTPGNWDAYDDEVIELDYDAMHARMLYKESIDKDWGEKDPFEIHRNNPDYRKLIKEAFYTLVNAESPEEARKSIQQNINYRRLPDLGMNGEKVVEEVKNHHTAISHEFGTGAGLRLQRKDSDIAERVMLEMLDKGWIVLPMHDSFIVQVGAREELENAMHQAFLDKLQMPCPISKKQDMSNLRETYNEHLDDKIDLESILDQSAFDDLKARVNPSRDRRDYSRYYTLWDVMQFRKQKKAA